jgi:hypothetical protein
MTFEEILDQAMAMLQRRGRVSYRALKLQFSLDDDHLEALKEELLYAQRVAVDEDHRVLVWAGGVRARVEPTHTPTQPVEPAEAQEPPPDQATWPPTEPRAPEA